MTYRANPHEPGEAVLLWARAIDSRTNDSLRDVRLQFWEDESTLLGEDYTDPDGVATAKKPYGTEYAVCTTIQYGYKPASNITTIAITQYRSKHHNRPDKK